MGSQVARETEQSTSTFSLEALCERLIAAVAVGRGQQLEMTTDLALQSLFQHVSDFVYIKDRAGRYVFANRAAVENLGLGPDFNISGCRDADIFTLSTADMTDSIEEILFSTGELARVQDERIELRDGRSQRVSTSKFPLKDASGEVIGLIGISRDVTERRNADDLRHGHAKLLELIARGAPLEAVLENLVHLVEAELEGVNASIFMLDDAGVRLSSVASPGLAPAYIKLIDNFTIGPKKGSCGTAAWRKSPVVVCDVMSDPLWEDYRELAVTFGFRSCWSTPILVNDGEILGTFALYSNAVREPTAREMELTAMATDIAGIAMERARKEERIRYMAHHDPLTGLANRSLFWTQFARALHQAQRERRTVTVAYVDLDNFKQINDSLGHAAGDAVLKALASRMSLAIRSSDLLVRLGGDEFAIVFNNPDHDEAAVISRLQRIRQAISEPVEIEGGEVVATCSMGVAFYPRDGEDPESLLASADRAMYSAKALGRDALQMSDHGDLPV